MLMVTPGSIGNVNSLHTLGGLGPELISDPNFNTPGAWQYNSGVTIADGKATFDNTNPSGYVRTSEGIMVAGTTYVIEFTIVDYVQGYVYFLANGSHSGMNGPFQNNGTYTATVTPTNTGKLFAFMHPTGWEGALSYFSAKEVL